METIKFVRRPFLIEAVEITEENIEEMAELVGTLCVDDKGQKYISVDRKKIPVLNVVYPGYWYTILGGKRRCYTAKAFAAQFVESNTELERWIDYLEDVPASAPEEVESVGDPA